MRALYAIFAIWFAVLLFPESKPPEQRPPVTEHVRERVFMSRTCTGSRWYLTESDEISVTVECDPQDEEAGQ